MFEYNISSGTGVEILSQKPIPYDTNPTPIQKQIELAVTNGRGCLSIKDSINLVNANTFAPRITFMDVLERGLIPLYLNGPLKYGLNYSNPCEENSLGKPMPVPNLFGDLPIRPMTVLEEIEMLQRVKFLRESCIPEPRDRFWFRDIA